MRAILLLTLVLGLTACGTTQNVAKTIPQNQYCHTEQVIVKDNNNSETNVQSRTVLTCTDKKDPMDSPLIKAGIAKSCGYYWDTMVLGGKDVWYKQMACFVGNEGSGRWIIVPNPVNN